MSKITLYDLPSKGRNSCWSLNPWKSRLALNYKGVDYETVWVEYPDIQPTLGPHVEPNEAPATPYTIPVVRFDESQYVMDSRKIVTRLENDYPSPSLHLDSPLLPIVEDLLSKVQEPMRCIWMPLIPSNLLNPRSAEYFTRTREEKFGKSLADLKAEAAGEEAWIEALPGLKGLGELLAREGGPFLLGRTPSYADFVIVGILQMYKRVDEGLLKKVINIESKLGNLYTACKPWLERDDS